MTMPKHAAKADRNQQEIVQALKRIGCDVEYIRTPVDLLVGLRNMNFLLEVKIPGGELTPEQKDFFAKWRGQKAVVTNIHEAFKAVGAVRE